MGSWHDYKGKYDPADFVVPPELEKGRSQRLQCYIQSHHFRLLNKLAHCGLFPFEDRADVARWCIHHGLQFLDTLEPGVTRSIIGQANIINHYLKNEIENHKFIDVFTNLKRQVSESIGRGEDDGARESVAFVHKQIMAMPDDTPHDVRWKCKYLDTLRADFGRFMPDEHP